MSNNPTSNDTGSNKRTLDEKFRTFFNDCASLIVNRIGADNVKAVYLCGSFANGEGSVALEPDKPIILSDVDIATVLGSIESHRIYFGLRDELGDACEQLMPGVVFAGRVDIGMYIPENLPKLPPSPGVFEFKYNSNTLYGDGTPLDSIPGYSRNQIGGKEAVTLVENRIISLLRTYIGEPRNTEQSVFRFMYGVGRAYTDMANSALCLSGMYMPGYEERCRFIVSRSNGFPVLRYLLSDLVDKIELWTSFKENPTLRLLNTGTDDSSLLALWFDCARDLIRFWIRSEAMLQGRQVEDERVISARTLLNSRGRGTYDLDNIRAWRSMFSSSSISGRFGSLLSHGLRILSCDPLDIVREYGVVLLDHRVENEEMHEVPKAPGGFPYGSRDWKEAVSELSSLWSELVFGRRGQVRNG